MTSFPSSVFDPLEKIANAVLYEGFLLYPYRKSSVKNAQRWHFGTIGPAGGADRTSMQTECLLEGGARTLVDVRIRFLQGEAERILVFSGLAMGTVAENRPFSFSPLDGSVQIASTIAGEGLFRFTCRILNRSETGPGDRSMFSTHTMLAVRDGSFISLTDPPDEHRSSAAACRNQGTWPVLAGPAGGRRLMLSSPIILYDYPQIAPESAGDLFDGTEIDEILTLRVLTLSEDERRQVREGDERGRDILERSESLPPEALAKMHGAIRGLQKAAPPMFREGDRVRLHPRKKADIFDIALDGRVAIIEAVERDYEGNIHLAVTVEDDPGRDLGAAIQIGHRFFFAPDDLEPI